MRRPNGRFNLRGSGCLSHQTAFCIRSTEKNLFAFLHFAKCTVEPPGTGFFGVETGHRKGPRALPETRRRKIDDKKGRQPRPEVTSLQKSSERTTEWAREDSNLQPDRYERHQD